MDMSNFRPELHVAQQSRRDKLRNHHAPNHHHHQLNPYNDIHHHHLPSRSNLSYDDPSGFCSEIPTPQDDYSNHPSDPQFGAWESVASQASADHWVSVARNNNDYQNSTYVGEGLSSVDPNMSALEVKPYSNELYHNALQELVSTSGVRTEETGHGPWVVNGSGGGELLLLPAYNDQIGSRPPEVHRWNGELNSNTQALSLSLSSVPSPKVHATTQIAERSSAMDFHSRDARQDVIGAQTALTHRTLGPLGPFTGYASILRSSRFLRPAQILLEELCCVARPKNIEICDEHDKMLEEVRVSGEGVCSGDFSGLFSIGFNGFNERSQEVGCASGWMDSCGPESLHKKAKLLYLQEEVSKRYKQYQQQMQMVVSSFESVEGLGASTPYVSLALKMVSKHFRCLKNAITDQLKSIRNALGEELMSPSGCTSGSKGDGRGSMLKFFDQSFQKQQKGTSSNINININNNSNSNNIGLLDGQHIWRPQRGLPERAVSVLRAWLFDHFLHPYPTDTDKHMLATQTGLTRNQVSNWFINARVRVWKPMVEEIHMLETKGMGETCSDGKTTHTSIDCDQPTDVGQCSNTTLQTSKVPGHNYSSVDYPVSSIWNQEKRSRIEYGVPTGVINDGSLMGLMPAGHQTVSLTLGLRQSAENGQRPQHYGGQFRRDFVG